jgi:hypothetical protein
MPKYYPFGRKTILLDIFIFDTTSLFWGEKTIAEYCIMEKTLNTSTFVSYTKLDHDGKIITM